MIVVFFPQACLHSNLTRCATLRSSKDAEHYQAIIAPRGWKHCDLLCGGKSLARQSTLAQRRARYMGDFRPLRVHPAYHG